MIALLPHKYKALRVRMVNLINFQMFIVKEKGADFIEN